MTNEKASLPTECIELEHAVAALIKNTRTTSRHLSLPDIAKWLDVAIKGFGSLGEVADRIGLSSKMLRQFLAVSDLSANVQELFAERQLDSVDMAVHLRMLSEDEQEVVANEAARKGLSTADVRAICEYRKENPGTPIDKIVEIVKSTRDIKQYVVEFVVRGSRMSQAELLNRFHTALGNENIVSLKLSGSIGRLVINQQGRSRLQALARENSTTQAEMVNRIVTGDLPQ